MKDCGVRGDEVVLVRGVERRRDPVGRVPRFGRVGAVPGPELLPVRREIGVVVPAVRRAELDLALAGGGQLRDVEREDVGELVDEGREQVGVVVGAGEVDGEVPPPRVVDVLADEREEVRAVGVADGVAGDDLADELA